MILPVIPHRAGTGWEMHLRANRKLTGTYGKLDLSAAPLAGEMEGPWSSQLISRQLRMSFWNYFLDYPVCRSVAYFLAHYLPPLLTHVTDHSLIYQIVYGAL